MPARKLTAVGMVVAIRVATLGLDQTLMGLQLLKVGQIVLEPEELRLVNQKVFQ